MKNNINKLDNKKFKILSEKSFQNRLAKDMLENISSLFTDDIESNSFLILDDMVSNNKDLLSLWSLDENSDYFMNIFINKNNLQLVFEENYKAWGFKEEVDMIKRIYNNKKIKEILSTSNFYEVNSNLSDILSDLENDWLMDFYIDYFRLLPESEQLEWCEKDLDWNPLIEIVDCYSDKFKETQHNLYQKFINYFNENNILTREDLEKEMWENGKDFSIFIKAFPKK